MHPTAPEPVPPTVRRPRLLGRDDEVRAVVEAVDSAARGLVTVTGPAGSGKTSLAAEVVHRLTVQFGRRWFVDLTALQADTDVPARVCHVLGLRPGAAGATEVLVAELSRGPALLVVDNCEHVLDEAARLVGDLAARCPELTVLATSRHALAVPGELTVPLGPLRTTDDDGRPGPAVQLLVERAHDAGVPRSVTAGDPEALVEVCRRLDGLPLAIVLAAHQLRTQRPADLAARLADDLTLPPMRGGAAHQRSISACLDRSLALLSTDAADLFGRLGVFVDRFEAGTCRAVCLPGHDLADVVDLLSELVEHSLLEVDTTASPTTYRFLSVIRSHARSVLSDETAADVAAALRSHLTAVFGATAEAGQAFTPDDVPPLAVLHDDAVAVVDAAAARGETTQVAELLLGLVRFWRVTGRIRFGVDHLLAAVPHLRGPAGIVARLVRADLERVLGLLAESEVDARDGLTAVRAAGPLLAHVEPYAAGVLGMTLADQGRYDEARALYHHVRATTDLAEQPGLAALWYASLGSIETRAGRDDEALELLLLARELFAARPVWLLGRVLGELSTLARRRGDTEAALELAVEGLDLLADYDALAEAAPLVDELASILDARGRHADASTCRAAARDLRRRVGAPLGTADDTPALGLDIGDVSALARQVPTVDPVEALTPRELEVAGLVADGLTNPQIAARLVISPGTARTHVERIRTKLAVPSRVHVARWMIERYVDRRIP